jgi:hypothetical protein
MQFIRLIRSGVVIRRRSSTVLLPVCTQNVINWTLITLIAVKNPHTQQTQTPNTDGRNFSLNVSTLLITVTIIFLFGLLAITTSLDLRELGKVDVRRLPQQFVERSPTSLRRVELLRCGEMAYKLDPSCTSMNVLKQPAV